MAGSRIRKNHVAENDQSRAIFDEKTKESREKRSRDSEKGKIDGVVKTGIIGETSSGRVQVSYQETIDI